MYKSLYQCQHTTHHEGFGSEGTWSCVSGRGRWRILRRRFCLLKYVQRQKPNPRSRDDTLLLFGSCPIRKGTTISMKDMLRWELGGPFQGLVRGSLSFLGLRLQHVPIPCLFVGGKMRVVLVVPGVGTICQL